jgi:DNA-directed RNA polymerase I, II, and III subunit RPABC2
MSDLEQSDIENMSDDEGSVGEIENSSAPTFTNNVKSSIINLNEKNEVENNNEEDGDSVIDDDDAGSQIEDDDDVDSIVNSEDDGEDEDDDEDMNDDDISIDEDTGVINKKTKTTVKKSSKIVTELPTTTLNLPVEFEKHESDYESDDDEEEDDDYLQKFDREMRDNYILDQHPESVNHNYDEIYNLAKVQRNKENIIIDDLHKTIPLLTKYEKTRILGQRAKQLNNGAKPLVKLDIPLIDGYLIALKELEEKMIPVIIRRPLPSGASEYWHLKDLEVL